MELARPGRVGAEGRPFARDAATRIQCGPWWATVLVAAGAACAAFAAPARALEGVGASDRWGPSSHELRLRYEAFDPLTGEPAVPAALRAGPNHRVFIVQFVSQPREAYRDALAAAGAVIHRYLPHHAYVVEMSPEAAGAVAFQPWVRWVGPFHPAYRLDEALIPALLSGPSVGVAARYNIEVFERGPRQKQIVAERVAALGGTVEAMIDDGCLLEATLTGGQLLSLLAMNEVCFVDRWMPVQYYMDNVRIDGGANHVESVAGYTGRGVRGEALDSGLDVSHRAFQHRPPLLHGLNTPPQQWGHGTAVFGTNFSDGDGNPAARGLVPDAQGLFAAVPNLVNRYTHTAELLAAPYFAVYQTNSWGRGLTQDYTTFTREIDDIAFIYDFLMLQAQANDGSRWSDHFAWAKNVISVGGIIHFNNANRGDDRWDGAGSIGPARDGRIKPDLAYWYDNILTTWPGNQFNPNFGGTSAATPETAGHCGLMFQMWADGAFGNPVDPHGTVFDNRPRLATARALMINSAQPYDFSGREHDLSRYHQGWGTANVRNLYDARQRMFVIDETDVLANLDRRRYELTVPPNTPALKATLVYTDPPGTTNADLHRINDLSLRVISPSGVMYWGNNGLRDANESAPGGQADVLDPVENVWIADPEPGRWTIVIRADEVNQDAHLETPEMDADFALVVSGVEPVGRIDCDRIRKLTATCRDGTLKVKAASRLPQGTRLTLDNDGQRKVMTLNERGKGKVTFRGQSGPKRVVALECPEHTAQADCG